MRCLFVNERGIQEESVKDGTIELEYIQQKVDGYIERYIIPCLEEQNIDLWCNDEGKINGLETRLLVVKNGETIEIICGNFCFLGSTPEGETIGLTKEQVQFVLSKLMIAVLKSGEHMLAIKYE